MASNNWRQHFGNLSSNEDGDRNMDSFGLALGSGVPISSKIGNLVEEIDTLFFVADDEKRIQTIHSPENLGVTRICKENKVVW